MDLLIYSIIYFVFFIPLILMMHVPVYKNHKKITGGMINYDSFMRKFVYKIYLSKEQTITSLKTRNAADELTCSFDFDKNIIEFAEYGNKHKYFFQILEYNHYSILRLEQVALISGGNQIVYKLNPFIVRKLSAEIIPFSRYGF